MSSSGQRTASGSRFNAQAKADQPRYSPTLAIRLSSTGLDAGTKGYEAEHSSNGVCSMPPPFGSPLALARFELPGDPIAEQAEAPHAVPHPEPLLTIPQFAARLGMSVSTLQRRIVDKTVRVLKLGRLVRIHPSELSRLLDNPEYERETDSIDAHPECIMGISVE